jgi:hypothetical protein
MTLTEFLSSEGGPVKTENGNIEEKGKSDGLLNPVEQKFFSEFLDTLLLDQSPNSVDASNWLFKEPSLQYNANVADVLKHEHSVQVEQSTFELVPVTNGANALPVMDSTNNVNITDLNSLNGLNNWIVNQQYDVPPFFSVLGQFTPPHPIVSIPVQIHQATVDPLSIKADTFDERPKKKAKLSPVTIQPKVEENREEKRQGHILAEQRRRTSIKSSYDTLIELVPLKSNQPKTKTNVLFQSKRLLIYFI